jgi:hypothetical protein
VTRFSARAAIGVCAGALVVLAGAWAGGAAPLPAHVPEAYTSCGESGRIPVGDALVVNGQPMQLSLFSTGDAPAQVIGFYADAFRKRGLLPVATGQAHFGHVSVFDPEDGLQRFVTALPERSGQTLVLVGVTDPRHATRLISGASRAPYPVPEEHRAFLAYSSEDGGARAHSGQFVTALAVSEVAEFYRSRLAAQGYAEKKEESAQGLLVFAKPGETLSVALQSLGEERGAAVFVNRAEGAP